MQEWGVDVRWVRTHPLTGRNCQPNWGVRVKMTLGMQEMWTSTTRFFKNLAGGGGGSIPRPPLDAHASGTRTHQCEILPTALLGYAKTL